MISFCSGPNLYSPSKPRISFHGDLQGCVVVQLTISDKQGGSCYPSDGDVGYNQLRIRTCGSCQFQQREFICRSLDLLCPSSLNTTTPIPKVYPDHLLGQNNLPSPQSLTTISQTLVQSPISSYHPPSLATSPHHWLPSPRYWLSDPIFSSYEY